MSTLEPIAMPEKISSEMEHTTDAPQKKKRGKSAAGVREIRCIVVGESAHKDAPA